MSHSYLKKKVVGINESIKVPVKINPIIVVLKWIWGVLGCWLLLIPTIQAISATVKFKTTEFLVTDKRVMEKYGWLSTHTDEMPLGKIENITVDYTFWGKILNYGTITFQGANRNNVKFTWVKDAESIKKRINEMI